MTAEPRRRLSPLRSRRAARPRALAAALAAGAVTLTGCASGGDAAPSSSAPASVSASASPAAGLALGDRRDQRMAAAAAARAAQFGFTRQQAVTPEEVAAARQDHRQRRTDGGRTTVEPASCKAPLAALDFSPILLEQETVSRVDVGADSFQGTGTVEVAQLDGPARQEVERHLQTVNTLLQGCPSMQMTVQEDGTSTAYRLTTAAAPRSEGSPAQAGLVWKRSKASASSPEVTAQVLTAVTSDSVVMVSFTGQEQAGDKQFTLMAEEMLAAAVRAG